MKNQVKHQKYWIKYIKELYCSLKKEQYELKCLSSTLIPFDPSETMSANIQQNTALPKNSVGTLQACPPDKCSCGHDLNEPVQESYDAMLVNRYNILKVLGKYCSTLWIVH